MNKLTKVSFIRRDKRSQTYPIYRCTCGTVKEIRDSSVRSGNTKTCGSQKCVTKYHEGALQSGAYSSWKAMRGRVLSKKHENYHQYGGRGITIDASWESFNKFYTDMGDRPEGKTLDRIDTNGNYEKGNCKWSTLREQALNRRKREGSSKYRGVSLLRSGKYQASLRNEGMSCYLGTYDEEEEAAIAYNRKVVELGSGGILNKIETKNKPKQTQTKYKQEIDYEQQKR